MAKVAPFRPLLCLTAKTARVVQKGLAGVMEGTSQTNSCHGWPFMPRPRGLERALPATATMTSSRLPGGYPIDSAQIAWIAIGRERILYLPLADWTVVRYCLTFFVWRPWQRAFGCMGAIAQRALAIESHPPEGSVLSELAATGHCLWSQADDRHGIGDFCALRSGSSGPLQKDSILCVDRNGTGVSLAKAASGIRASSTIEREAANLRRLNELSNARWSVASFAFNGCIEERSCVPEHIGCSDPPYVGRLRT